MHAASPSPTYTVPAGNVAVVRDVTITSSTGGTDAGGWGVPGTAFLGAFRLSSTVPEYRWKGRQVFTAGESIAMIWQGGGFYYAVSGYLLTP